MSNQKHFQLSRVPGAPVSDEELLADLKKVSAELGTDKITQALYKKHGEFDCSTQLRRFETWNTALEQAGLKASNKLNYSEEELFENILTLWTYYGRQPRRSELAQHPSCISQSPYNRTFGSWGKALEAFVNYANAEGFENYDHQAVKDKKSRQTGRDPSLRLRYKVLKRDSFTCQSCGASPAKTQNVELHIDHIYPWSEGGETVLENLRTLCSKCNLGKGAMVP